MERILKNKIIEDKERLVGSPQVFDKMMGNKRNQELFNTFLEDSRVQTVYKVAIDLKSSICYMIDVGEHLECHIPIKDSPIHFLDDFISIFVDRGVPYIDVRAPIYTGEIGSAELQNVLKKLVEQLEGEFGDHLNFKILKEYLEEE